MVKQTVLTEIGCILSVKGTMNDDKWHSDETQINILFKNAFIIKIDISAMLTT